MFIEIVEDIWINLNQLNDIQIIDNNDLWFSNDIEHQGFIVVAFTNYGRFIVKDKEFYNNKDENFVVINDFYIFDETFKTKKEAKNFIINKLGIHLINPNIQNRIN